MSSKLQSQVIEFHKLGGQDIEPVPTVPSKKVIALRVSLVIEESLEFFEACYGSVPEKMIIEEMVRNVLRVREPRLDLAEAADALGDIDYVVEGSRLAFGIDGESVADEIHSANLKKVEGKIAKLASGKVGKPSQWSPPDIEGVLVKQNAGVLPSVGNRLRELGLLEGSTEERWGVWVTTPIGTCDRESEDGWMCRQGVEWFGGEVEARKWAKELAEAPARQRYGHEAQRYKP